MRVRTNFVIMIALVSAAGCRAAATGDDAGGSPDSNPAGSPDSNPGGAQTVKSLRMNNTSVGTAVSLHGEVVVGRVSSAKSAHVWIQDQGGGQYSGIDVYCAYATAHPSCTMTKAQIDALSIGQVVDVTGSFDSFTPTTPAGAQAELEISSPIITNSGGIMTPVPVDVDAATIAKDQASAAGATPYKGAYVRVSGSAMVTSAMPGEFTAACTSSTGVAGTTYHGFEASSGSSTLAVGLGFYNTLTYCVPDCGYTCNNQITNQTFTSVTGVVEADSNSTTGDVFLKISPVQDTDLPLH